MDFTVVYELDVLNILAIFISCVALYYTYTRSKFAIESLSLNVFISALRELSSPESRIERREIFELFDKIISGEKGMMKSDEYIDVDVWLKKGKNSPVNVKYKIKKLNSEDKKRFQEISVKYDRVGFMLFDLNISPVFQKKYLDWMCVSICDMWNVLAPYILLERGDRIKFTPNFEKLAYEAFPYYNLIYQEKHEKPAKIIVLKPSYHFNLF